MKLTFLGTCSGTEPMPERRHVSFVIESGEGVYWFDAGEGCSHTAHLAGVDLISVRAIFISHAHIDHIGGLANLIFNMGKLNVRSEQSPRPLDGRTLPLFIPDRAVWDGIAAILAPTMPECFLEVDAREYGDGTVFDDGVLRVLALHNRHLGEPGPGGRWRSYSFRIEAQGQSIVYSGDIADVSELEPLLDGCDALLVETGHHKVEAVCDFLNESGKAPRRLVFVHHGRAILTDPEAELRKARALLGDDVVIADDGLVLAL